MIDALGLEDPPIALLLLGAGAALGVLFGAAAQVSRFCLRRALVGPAAERAAAGGVWAAALAAATLGAQGLAATGALSFAETHHLAPALPLLALVLGGLAFGSGMTLSGGCASRLIVLGAAGNLRAALVILVFAAVALTTMRGALAPAAAWLREAGAIAGAGGALDGRLPLPGAGPLLAGLAALGLGALAWRSGARRRDLALGALIGLLIAGGWAATGLLLADPFDPRPAESLAFTAGAGETLFYLVAGTAIQPSFGLGVLTGALLGAHLSARLRGEIALKSFSAPEETLRYLTGGALMGFGGALAGGCTIGAGLSGVSTLGAAPLITLLAIIAGAKLTRLGAPRHGPRPRPA